MIKSINLICFFSILFFQEATPFRHEDNFEVKLHYDFKQRPVPERNEVNFLEVNKIRDTSLLPYLEVDVGLSNLSVAEYRYKVVDNFGVVHNALKLKADKPIHIDMGFTDDMKDRTGPHVYEIIILTKKRKPLNRIRFEVAKDGTFYLNDKLNGKL